MYLVLTVEATDKELKNFIRKQQKLFLLLLLAFLLLVFFVFNLYRSRDIRISGRIEGTQKGERVDVRVMFFDTDSGANIVKDVEYDDVQTTSDGRFDLVYKTNLVSLPGDAYMQVCIRNAQSDSYGIVPICVESSEVALPSRVQGLATEDIVVVSCTREQISGGLSGVLERAFGFAPKAYEFYEYCMDVYTREEHSARLNSISSLNLSDQASVLGDPFVTIDSVVRSAVAYQTLKVEDNKLTISDGNSVDLPLQAFVDRDTDEQTLSIAGSTVSISGGNSISLPVAEAPAPITVSLGAGLSGSASVASGGSLSLNSTGVLDISGSGPITSSGGQNPVIDLTLCANGQVLQVSGGVWACNTTAGTYTFSVTDGVTPQGISNGDQITFAAGAGLQSNVAATDVVTYSVSPGGVGSTEIANGSIANVDLANNSLTITAGSGLNGGGSVSLGGSVALSNAGVLSVGVTGPITTSGGQNPSISLAACAGGEVLKYNSGVSAWQCAVDVDTDTNTDTQDLSLSTNTLSLVDGGSVDLSGYLDNTDSQDLTLTANTLALSGDGTTVDLSSYLDNTDVLGDLSCSTNEIASWNGTAWICSTDNVNDADFSTTNEIQDLSLSSNILALSGDGTTVDLSSYLDNTDVLADLSCSDGQVASWNNGGSAWECTSASVDTDDQTLSIDGSNNLVIVDGNSVSLAAYLDNTDSQDLTLTANTLALSGDGTTVDLSGFLDNTDAQAISVATNILSISGNVGTVDLSPYLDNTDTQDLSLSTNTLSLVDGGSVDLSGYLDNTDVVADLSCTSGQVSEWSGSAWVCGTDDGLTSEVDGIIGNEILNVAVNGGLVRTGAGTGGDPYTVGLRTDCTTDDYLAWSGTSWDCTPKFPIAQYRDGAGGTSLNDATATALPWNTEDFEETGITHDTVTNNTRVQLDAVGTYRISYTVSGDKDTANSRATVGCNIRMNGSTVLSEGASYSYNRNSANDSASNVSTTLIATSAASDYFEIICVQTGDTPVVLSLANESWVTVERIR